ncbi:MAG: hypothetical protein QME77_09680, partial [bacterium]|nr:hypothetical protein [bacterium]
TVLVWLRGRDAISFTVEVGTGVPSERDRIVEILEKVGGVTDPIRAVWIGTALVLTGTVRNQVIRDNLQAIASSAIRGMRDVSVVNQIEVRDPIQYKVAVRVTEIDNNALKELGVQWGMYWKGIVQDPATGAYVVAPDGTFPDLRLGMLLFGLSGGGIMPLSGAQIAAQLLPFVQRGQATMLASPSVVTLAGKQAQIVVGGQIPVPGGNGTVEYRPYGAVLKFTPEHTGEGRLSLTLEASSSQLDWSNMVEVSGSRMPALIDRRVITQVSLQVGETFALGGMVAHVRQEWVQQIPILGSLPILGVLFRIKRFQERRSEVLFFVTPEEVSR